MSKLWTLAALSAIMLMGLAAHAGNYVYVNGRAMMPARSFHEVSGATISYDSRHGVQITLGTGFLKQLFGIRTRRYDRDVVVIDGVPYIPVDDVQQYGYDSYCDSRTNQIIIMHPRTHRRVVLDWDQSWQQHHPDSQRPNYSDNNWNRDRQGNDQRTWNGNDDRQYRDQQPDRYQDGRDNRQQNDRQQGNGRDNRQQDDRQQGNGRDNRQQNDRQQGNEQNNNHGSDNNQGQGDRNRD